MLIHYNPPSRFVLRSRDVFEMCRDILGREDEVDKDKEHLWVFHLNARSKIKLIELAVLGTLDKALFTPRDVFRRAITSGTFRLIVAHNHPSGDPSLSPEDIAATEQLMRAGEILQIQVLDHIVVGEDGYKSYRELFGGSTGQQVK
jgi:DNA repair protein RadC